MFAFISLNYPVFSFMAPGTCLRLFATKLSRFKLYPTFEANHAYCRYINQNNAFSLFSLNYAVVSVNARKRFLFLVWLWIKQFLALSHQMVWASSHGTKRYCFFVAKLSSVQYYRAQNVFPLVCCCYAEFSCLAVNFFSPCLPLVHLF